MNLAPGLPDFPVQEPFEPCLIHAELELPAPSRREYPLSGFQAGCGTGNAPGRFGFTKGDGILDCAMPYLGVISKLYLCGHPKYRKPFFWVYSTLPRGVPRHGSFDGRECGISNDRIAVNPLSVSWETALDGGFFRCTYSLATPGIITEKEPGGDMELSQLEYAGNYTKILIPRKEGVEVCPLEKASNWHLMSENWLLLFGCTEFPDLPLMLVFDRPPQSMETGRTPNGRLSRLVFRGIPLMITATPFGIESLEPIAFDDTVRLADAVRRCRFWSRAFLAYPVRCEEYFKIDHEAETVTVIEKFSYRHIQDAWNTEPLELAALPPVLSISGNAVCDDDVFDFRFPTKYGYLRGREGNMVSYTIPLMPTARRFPLKEEGSDLPELLQKGLTEYFRFSARFPETVQAYPYAGSLMEPFALPTTMMGFMPEKEREELRKLAMERLRKACERDRQYDYPVIDFNCMMKTMPSDADTIRIYEDRRMRRLHLWNWYERTEPFTKFHYHICYLNVCLFHGGKIREGTREEVAGLNFPLIENDWGVGLTFYYMYLCALAGGDFTPVRDSWELIKSVYSFFEQMQDWACMGTGYSDNALLWVEGANYGAFTAFINLAEAVGDTESEKHGMYLAAKQLALRTAILNATPTYFHRFYEVEPWYIAKSFHEENNPSGQFQGVPKTMQSGRYRPGGIYNLTTEGFYPELYEAMRHFAPEVFAHTMRLAKTHAHDNRECWQAVQQNTALLIDEALDDSVPESVLREDLAAAELHNTLVREWRGIHIFSRRLPENYFKAQILAWNRMKQHPVWMEHWENLAIVSGEWSIRHTAQIRFRKLPGKAKLRLGIRRMPPRALLNGVEISMTVCRTGKIEFHPEESGTLEIFFNSIAGE